MFAWTRLSAWRYDDEPHHLLKEGLPCNDSAVLLRF